jgi:hypothetical protein
MTVESITSIPAQSLAVKTFGVTDKGEVRSANEDQFLIAELSKSRFPGARDVPAGGAPR